MNTYKITYKFDKEGIPTQYQYIKAKDEVEAQNLFRQHAFDINLSLYTILAVDESEVTIRKRSMNNLADARDVEKLQKRLDDLEFILGINEDDSQARYGRLIRTRLGTIEISGSEIMARNKD